jgi:L,D-peptidoglycan transpeptidase YkuD (ErfK/YbiS/YcfS/YnhG family)
VPTGTRTPSGSQPPPDSHTPSGRRWWLVLTVLALVAGLLLAGSLLRPDRPADSMAAGLAAMPPATATASAASTATAAPSPSLAPPASTRPPARRGAVVATSKPPATASTPPPNLASRLRTLPAGTRQVVIVHSTGYASTYATLETFEKVGGVWRRTYPAMPARIGQDGFTDHAAEGYPATPTGVYGFGATMYGVSADPGVRYGYHVLVEGDYWDENSNSPTYNTFVHGSDPGAASEALWQSPTAYSHFAFITYNVPAVPGKGSAIFLHQSLGKATAGCVALTGTDLVRVLTWLDPAATPRIVLGPDSVLGRY